MALQLNRLSALKVKTETREGWYHDGGGLYLQVAASGAKSWIFCYMLYGRCREMGLGSLNAVSLADARNKVANCRKLLDQKIDPIDTRKAERTAARLASTAGMTFRECAESCIKAREGGWRDAKQAQQWRNTLDAYVYPKIGKLPVQSIDVGLVLKVLEPIWAEKPETANRIRGRIENILDWASAREYRTGENPARWRGRLENLLPPHRKLKKVVHHAALPFTKVGDFMARLDGQSGMDARALEFTILTATRTNECLGAKWEEIDLVNKVWAVPANRMKASKEHRVPLSDRAIEVLRKAEVLASKRKDPSLPLDQQRTGWVFAGQKKDRPLSNMAMLVLLRRMKATDITVHGFRSTFRDWTAERTAYSREVAEAALAHTVGNKVEAAYRRGDLFGKRRHLMDEWAEYCGKSSVDEAAKIVSIAEARQEKIAVGAR
ncbi:MAG: tyrosine-type recombinase/integrase [Alphaproteobacteria bacterium]|nr:tyrosine-type recombinase/integrase [Alphaproteobacteria bacterium]